MSATKKDINPPRTWSRLLRGVGVLLVVFAVGTWGSVEHYNREHEAGSDAVRFGFSQIEPPANHAGGIGMIVVGVALFVLGQVIANRLRERSRQVR